ncbi:hypothetical protein AAHZ94_03910 [Streptomyces sp. HSW2009]
MPDSDRGFDLDSDPCLDLGLGLGLGAAAPRFAAYRSARRSRKRTPEP